MSDDKWKKIRDSIDVIPMHFYVKEKGVQGQPSKYMKDKNGKLIVAENQLRTACKFLDKIDMGAEYIGEVSMIGGKPSTTSKLLTAMAIKTKHLAGMEEFMFDELGLKICQENKNLHKEAFGAFCKVKRSEGNEFPKTFSRTDAKTAGLLSKGTWAKYPSDMMAHKARNRALNAAFPELSVEASLGEGYEYQTDEDLKESAAETEMFFDETKQVKDIQDPSLNHALQDVEEKKELEEDESPVEMPSEDEQRRFNAKLAQFRIAEKKCEDAGLKKKEKRVTDAELAENFPYKMDLYLERCSELLKGVE